MKRRRMILFLCLRETLNKEAPTVLVTLRSTRLQDPVTIKVTMKATRSLLLSFRVHPILL
jgi:hypothetical protein